MVYRLELRQDIMAPVALLLHATREPDAGRPARMSQHSLRRDEIAAERAVFIVTLVAAHADRDRRHYPLLGDDPLLQVAAEEVLGISRMRVLRREPQAELAGAGRRHADLRAA